MPRAATRRQADAPAELTPAALARMINKKWPGAMTFASDPKHVITRLPTGILSIDTLLGGGFARNRHHEIFGTHNVGKTYITYRLIGRTQADGGTAAFVDVERTFDPEFAESAGVDLSQLAMPEHLHANRVIDVVETMLRSQLYDVIVVDSIASLLPKSELEADMDASTMGTAQAKLMSAALRRLTAANSRTALVFINQTREAIGVTFGKRSVTSGGKAMGFYAGTRLELVRTENIKRPGRYIDPAKGDEVTKDIVKGHRVLVRVEKDKTGSSHMGAETTFVYDYELGGIDHVEDLLYLGRQHQLISKSSTHWWLDGYEDEKQQGRKRFKSWLRRNPVYAEELQERIMAAADEEPLVTDGVEDEDD